MSQDQDYTVVIDVPPTEKAVIQQAGMYQGKVHGTDRDGYTDVEFADMYHAAVFMQSVSVALGWVGDIRPGDSVTKLNEPVTITIRPTYEPRAL